MGEEEKKRVRVKAPRYKRKFLPVPRDTRKIPHFGADNEFPQIFGGEPNRMNWRRKDFRMQCCDCSLIHRFRFNVRGEWLVIRGLREEK